jgi:hypothetical protein
MPLLQHIAVWHNLVAGSKGTPYWTQGRNIYGLILSCIQRKKSVYGTNGASAMGIQMWQSRDNVQSRSSAINRFCVASAIPVQYNITLIWSYVPKCLHWSEWQKLVKLFLWFQNRFGCFICVKAICYPQCCIFKAVFRNLTPFSLVDGCLLNELHSIAFGIYCDMTPENQNREIRGDVNC